MNQLAQFDIFCENGSAVDMKLSQNFVLHPSCQRNTISFSTHAFHFNFFRFNLMSTITHQFPLQGIWGHHPSLLAVDSDIGGGRKFWGGVPSNPTALLKYLSLSFKCWKRISVEKSDRSVCYKKETSRVSGIKIRRHRKFLFGQKQMIVT